MSMTWNEQERQYEWEGSVHDLFGHKAKGIKRKVTKSATGGKR